MKRFDFDMHDRLVEEIYRISDNDAELSRKIGASSNVVKTWTNKPIMPVAWYLARLYREGADVIYILTGERTR